MDGKSDLAVRFLAAAVGVHTSGLHHRKTALHRVEEEPHITDAVYRRGPARGRVPAAETLDVALGLGHVELLPDHVVQRRALEGRAVQSEQRPGVTLGQAVGPQAVEHVRGKLQ